MTFVAMITRHIDANVRWSKQISTSTPKRATSPIDNELLKENLMLLISSFYSNLVALSFTDYFIFPFTDVSAKIKGIFAQNHLLGSV
jgi:hypothetical protein